MKKTELKRKTPMKAKSTAPAKQMKRKCDELDSLIVRHKARCVAAEYQVPHDAPLWSDPICGGKIECCHLKSRGELRLRYHPLNRVPMCHVHHRFFTMNPDLWTKFIESKFPGRWDTLNELKQTLPKLDWQETYERLKKEYDLLQKEQAK